MVMYVPGLTQVGATLSIPGATLKVPALSVSRQLQVTRIFPEVARSGTVKTIVVEVAETTLAAGAGAVVPAFEVPR